MRSIVWSEEEASYLKAMLAWDEPIPDSILNRRLGEASRKPPVERKRAVDEFRVLVVGARGTGKTSILTRVCLLDRFFEDGLAAVRHRHAPRRTIGHASCAP
jgi:hypothetical protein